MNFIPAEKAFPIRQPSTANLMVDSQDRNVTAYPSPWDFQISKPNSILNGYFTRVGVTEVVLEWCAPNISTDVSNNIFRIDISGTGANPFAVTGIPIPLSTGNYTVSEAIDDIVDTLNTLTGTTGATFAVVTNNGAPYISVSGAVVTVSISASNLNAQLELVALDSAVIRIGCPDLRTYRYLDFVSAQLTYAQDLKDSSTAPIVRDVLCRWYMAEDTQEQLDALGFPILMGYKQFCRRRLFSPPKQIRWDTNLPIGNITFQVYTEEGALLDEDTGNFLMTLQVSEV